MVRGWEGEGRGGGGGGNCCDCCLSCSGGESRSIVIMTTLDIVKLTRSSKV